MTSHSHDATHDGHRVGHVVGLPILFGVLGTLLALTVLTVAVTWVELGSLNLVVALVIATVKASLVVLYFMHLRWDKPFNAIIFIVALVLLAFFVGLALIDSEQYTPTMIPDFDHVTSR